MAETIHLPGMGETKKTTVYMIGAGLVLVGGIAYYRSKKTAAAAAQAASVAQAGGTTTDPATGYPYGSAEDAAALAAQANYNTGSGYAGYGYGNQYPYSGGQPGTSQTGFTDNASWAQAFETYATENLNANAAVVGNALGKYLTGQPLTSDQISVVEQAIAFEGYPPQAGTNGFPPSYHNIPSGGGNGGGTPPVKLPAVFTGPWLVQPGQTPTFIANRFGISVSHLQKMNPGKSITPGTILMIQYDTHPGMTVQDLANLYEIDPSHVLQYITTS